MDRPVTASVMHNLDARAARIAALTPRERDVLAGIISGCSNKMIAYRLGISVRTVEGHRAHIMRFLEAKHIAHVICAAIEAMRLGLFPDPAAVFGAQLAFIINEPCSGAPEPIIPMGDNRSPRRKSRVRRLR
jgi:DNA-binding CsgD family transcriptional regulator